MDIAPENTQVLRLVQAMIGAVTPNFRKVTLETMGANTIRLRFLLENDYSEDREEIDEIAFEFEALQDVDIEIEVIVVADPRPLQEVALPGRVVYGRKEAG